MTFGEKLVKLCASNGLPRTTGSKRAGLPKNGISDYINKGTLPRVDSAFRLSRVFQVPLDWLVDPASNWPPPDAPSTTPPAVALPTLDDCGRALLRRLADQLSGPRLLDAITAASDALSRQLDPPEEVAYATAEPSSPSEGGAA